MGYEERSREMHLNTLREVTVRSADGRVLVVQGRKVQCDLRTVVWTGDDGSENVLVLMPGDHLKMLALENPSVIPIGSKIEVVS